MRLSWPLPACLLTLLPGLAQAAWLPGGNPIGDGTGYNHAFAATASGPDRLIVTWLQQVAPGKSEVRAQAWTAEGARVAGWPEAGLLVSDRGRDYPLPAIAGDAAGGAYIAWVAEGDAEATVRLQRVSAAGEVAAGWPAEGLQIYPLGPYYSRTPTLAPDGAGGVLVGRFEYRNVDDYGVVIDRFDPAGARHLEWPVGGLSVPYAYAVGLAVDAQQHLFVSTIEYDPVAREPLGIRVRRLDGRGAPDPAWPPVGTLLSQAKHAGSTRLFPDGAGGVFVDWDVAIICLPYCPSLPDRRTARVLGDGSQDDRWTSGRAAYSVAPDGTGGLLLGLVSRGRPAALRLDAGGAVWPGWTASGNPAMTEVVEAWELRVAGDGRGGAFVVWEDPRGGDSRHYASRLDPSGRRAPGWPATGSRVGTGRTRASGVQLVSLATDVTVAVWGEWTGPGAAGYVTALQPGEPGPVVDLGPVGAEVGFGIVQAAPNPTRGAIVATVELPDVGPARLDLVDATGRVLESRDYAFLRQAWGRVRLNESGALPAGVYWLRLVQGGRQASRKVVVLE